MLGRRLIALGVCLLGLTSRPAFASTLREINLGELVQTADRIFMGKCVASRSERDVGLGIDVTVVTFEVAQPLKGQLADTVTIRIADLGGERFGRAGGAFRAGEETILFLHADSRSGLTSPVGLGQGKFAVIRDKSARAWAVNEYGNRGLSAALSPEVASRLGERGRRWSKESAIPVDELVAMVQSLIPPASPPTAATPGPAAKRSGR